VLVSQEGRLRVVRMGRDGFYMTQLTSKSDEELADRKKDKPHKLQADQYAVRIKIDSLGGLAGVDYGLRGNPSRKKMFDARSIGIMLNRNTRAANIGKEERPHYTVLASIVVRVMKSKVESHLDKRILSKFQRFSYSDKSCILSNVHDMTMRSIRCFMVPRARDNDSEDELQRMRNNVARAICDMIYRLNRLCVCLGQRLYRQ